MLNIGFFLSENFHFLVVKFSVYLNRRVFVMQRRGTGYFVAISCCHYHYYYYCYLSVFTTVSVYEYQIQHAYTNST